jgi:hypothetical protein
MRNNRELAACFGADVDTFIELAIKGLAQKAGKSFGSWRIDIMD